MTKVFIEQPLALPKSANYSYVLSLNYLGLLVLTKRQAMVLWPPIWGGDSDHLAEQTRTDMSASGVEYYAVS